MCTVTAASQGMQSAQKLYMIYIGGYIEGSLIELHDMRFVVASSIEETFPALRSS